MRRIVLESPYRGATEEETHANIAYAKRCVLDALRRGDAPIASHLLFAQSGILIDTHPGERQLGIAAGHAWIPMADAVVFYTDRGFSEGMWIAKDVAVQAGKIVELRTIGSV